MKIKFAFFIKDQLPKMITLTFHREMIAAPSIWKLFWRVSGRMSNNKWELSEITCRPNISQIEELTFL